MVCAGLLGLVAVALRGNAPQGRPVAGASDGAIGLFTTLPILWAETEDVAGLLRRDATPHWARDVLAREGAIVPLDNLAQLRGIGLLVMAQPRPLSPQENVAVDRWVRGGGRLLLFADPMLTAPSAYALGDRRRPQDVVLISPLLGHWGMRLTFDEAQGLGDTIVPVADARVTMNLPGRVEITDGVACRSEGQGHGARCRIGKGAVLVVADAALFEQGTAEAARGEALARLIASLR